MQLSDFDAIIFDSDGVLVDSEVIHVAVERELLSEIGLTYEYETYLSRFVGLSMPDFYAALAEDYQQEKGEPFPDDFPERLAERMWPRVEAELKPISGVADLVRAFSGKTAVASSAPTKRLRQKLGIAGLLPLFEPHIYSARMVEKGKPAPDLFLLAAEKLNVSPAKCLVIEDSINGVLAGCRAGMTVAGFTGGSHADKGLNDRLLAAGAHLVFESHSEIASRLCDN